MKRNSRQLFVQSWYQDRPNIIIWNSNNEVTSVKGELNSNQNLNTDFYGLVSGSDVMSLFKDFRWSFLNVIPRVSAKQEYEFYS